MNKINSVLFLLGFLCSSLFSFSLINKKYILDYKKFEMERAAWEELNIQDYSYEYFSKEFNYFDVLVNVENGQYVNSVPLGDSDLTSYEKTIDDIYDKIWEVYTNNKDDKFTLNEPNLISISVLYNDEHVPERVHYSYYVPADHTIDGNFYFEIRNFSHK